VFTPVCLQFQSTPYCTLSGISRLRYWVHLPCRSPKSSLIVLFLRFTAVSPKVYTGKSASLTLRIRTPFNSIRAMSGFYTLVRLYTSLMSKNCHSLVVYHLSMLCLVYPLSVVHVPLKDYGLQVFLSCYPRKVGKEN
jgi:hypothetical protein